MARMPQCICGGVLPVAAGVKEIVCPWCGRKVPAAQAVPEPSPGGQEVLPPLEAAPEPSPTCKRPWMGIVIGVAMLVATAALVTVGRVNAHEKTKRDRLRAMVTEARSLQDQGRHAEAAAKYQRVLERGESGTAIRSDLKSVIASAAVAKGRAELLARMAPIREEAQALVDAGRPAQAAAAYERLIAGEPEGAEGRVAKFFRSARAELDAARADAARLDALQLVLEEVARAISAGDLAAAREAIRTARADGADPDGLLESVGRFLAALPPRERTGVSDEVIDRMRADMGLWMRARRRNTADGYEEFAKARPESPFTAEARQRAVDLEVADILGHRPGRLPQPRRVGNGINRNFSVVNITNSTEHTLTVRFSGVESFKVVFKPHEEGSVELLNGSYRVAATVDWPRINPFAGTNSFNGANYVSRFFIKTVSAFAPQINIPTIPAMFGAGRRSAPAFTPAPPKRLLPEHLKRIIEPARPARTANRSRPSASRSAPRPTRPTRRSSSRSGPDQGTIRMRRADGTVITIDTLSP